jgi:hypothetical protein
MCAVHYRQQINARHRDRKPGRAYSPERARAGDQLRKQRAKARCAPVRERNMAPEQRSARARHAATIPGS